MQLTYPSLKTAIEDDVGGILFVESLMKSDVNISPEEIFKRTPLIYIIPGVAIGPLKNSCKVVSLAGEYMQRVVMKNWEFSSSHRCYANNFHFINFNNAKEMYAFLKDYHPEIEIPRALERLKYR